MSEDFRQNGLIGVTGQQGVGKSFLNNLYAQQYILDNPKTRKVGKKVLIYDAVYDRQYANYPILKWTDIAKQPQRTIARVIPQHPNGRKFSAEDLKKGFYKLLAEYSNGMLILEDYNKYGLGTRNNDVIGPLTTARHNGVDILFSMQNMSKITTEIWENITWYRFHKQTTSVDAQRNDIENFELLKIAEIIVNEEYRKAALLFRAKKLTELEFKKRCSYHVWVDFKRLTIQGCSYEKFKWAALQMIIEQPRKISQYCKQKGYVYQKQSDYQAAVKELLISYLPLYQG